MRMGIVGCGRIGDRHAALYRDIADASLLACYDPDKSAAGSLAREYGAVTTPDLDDLLQLPLDGISVCTPPDAHIDVVVAAAQRGIRVLCEKPLATSVRDCRRIPRHAALACAFKFRHLSGAARLREMIINGDLGQILSIRGTAVSNIDMSRSWFSDPAVAGGGVLLDNGVHLIDLCRFLVGDVLEVNATVCGGSRRLPVEETASLNLRMECGAAAHILLSWEAPAPMPPLLEIYGSAGYAILGYELEVFDASGKNRVAYVSCEGVDVWREVIHNFAAYVRGDGQPIANLEDGFSAVSAVEAAYRSIETGKWEAPSGFHETVDKPH